MAEAPAWFLVRTASVDGWPRVVLQGATAGRSLVVLAMPRRLLCAQPRASEAEMRALFLAVLIVLPATSGALTPISVPDATYVSSTTLLNISDPLQSIVTSESQGALSISFFSGTQKLPMDVNQVGDAWAK